MNSDRAVWYLPGANATPSGPFAVDLVLDALQTLEVDGETLCWQEGMPDWRPLREVAPFAAAIHDLRSATPHPVPACPSPPVSVSVSPTSPMPSPGAAASRSSPGVWVGRGLLLLILLAIGGAGYVYVTELLALRNAKVAIADGNYDEAIREARNLRESFINADEAGYLCSAAEILEFASDDRPPSRDSELRRAQRQVDDLIKVDESWRARAKDDLAHAVNVVPADVEDALPRRVTVARCLQELQLSDGETLVASILDDASFTGNTATPPMDGKLVREVLDWSPTAADELLEVFVPASTEDSALQRGLFVIGGWCREEPELVEKFAAALIRHADKSLKADFPTAADAFLNTAQGLKPELAKEIATRRLDVVAKKLSEGDATALNQMDYVVRQNPDLKARAAEHALAAARSLSEESPEVAKAAAERAMQLNPDGIASEADTLLWIRLKPPAGEAKLRQCQTFLRDYPESPARFEVLSAIVADAIAIATQSDWNRPDPTPFFAAAQTAAAELIEKYSDSSGVDVAIVDLTKRLAAAGRHKEAADLLTSMKEAVPDTALMLEIDQLIGQWREQSGRGTLLREFDALADRVDRELKIIQLTTPAALRTLAHDPRAVHVVEVACTKDKFTTQETVLLRDWVRGGGVLWVNNDVLGLFDVTYRSGGNYDFTLAKAAVPESVCGILTGSSMVNLSSYRGAVNLQSPQAMPLLTSDGTSVWSLVKYGDGWLTDKKPVDVTRYDSARFWLNFRLFCMGEPIPGATTQIIDPSVAVNAAPGSSDATSPSLGLGLGQAFSGGYGSNYGAGYGMGYGAGYEESFPSGYGATPNTAPTPEPTIVATSKELDETLGNLDKEKVIWIQLEREQLGDQQVSCIQEWVDSGGVLWTDTDLAQSAFGFRLRRADANMIRNSAFTWRSNVPHPVVDGLADPVEYVLSGSGLLISVEIDRKGQPHGVQPFLGWPPENRASSYISAACGMKAVGRGIVIYRPRDVGGASQKQRFESNLRHFSFQQSNPTWSSTEPDTELRTWTDTTGTYQIEAEYVKSEDGKVHLKKSDGSIVQVPLEKLSPADQTHAKKLTEK